MRKTANKVYQFPQQKDWGKYDSSVFTRNVAWGPNSLELSLYLIENLPRNNFKSLEAGCGSGKWSLILTEHGYLPILVDFQIHILLQAKERFKQYGKKGYFVQADINQLPFKERTFDICFNDGTMEHFTHADRRHIIKEMTRVLDKNGINAIGVLNKCNPFQNVFHLFWADKKVDDEIISPFTLLKDMEKSKLKVKRYGTCIIFSFLLFYHLIRGSDSAKNLLKIAKKYGSDLISMHSKMSKLNIIRLIMKLNWLDKYFGEELFYIGKVSRL